MCLNDRVLKWSDTLHVLYMKPVSERESWGGGNDWSFTFRRNYDTFRDPIPIIFDFLERSPAAPKWKNIFNFVLSRQLWDYWILPSHQNWNFIILVLLHLGVTLAVSVVRFQNKMRFGKLKGFSKMEKYFQLCTTKTKPAYYDASECWLLSCARYQCWIWQFRRE